MKRDLSKTCYGFFQTLANPTRLAILELLNQSNLTVTELTEKLHQEQSMISHNLQFLEQCGLIHSNRNGKNKELKLNKTTVNTLFNLVEKHAQQHCPSKGKCPHAH